MHNKKKSQSLFNNFVISENNDITTDIVISWLINTAKRIKRLNIEESQTLTYKVENNKSYWLINDSKEIIKVWHRRGRLNFIEKSAPIKTHTYQYVKKEIDSIIKASELSLKDKNNYVGSFIKEAENYKPYQLEVALQNGLKVPETLITNSKKELIKFCAEFKKIITKDIRYPVNIDLKDQQLVSTGTILVSKEMVKKLRVQFVPMFFQEYIEKIYEIRIFFFKDDYYPMAIFSQNNEKTKIDFRNYDDEKPNRCVPVKLPEAILSKIKSFVQTYGLNTGSIDMIKSKKGDYIFLEVNPQGQLDWLSKNCNYYVEKRIANFFQNS